MFKEIKRAILTIRLRFSYREKLKELRQRMKRIAKKERKLEAIILRWEDKVASANILADKAKQESDMLWGKFRTIIHDMTLISSSSDNMDRLKRTINHQSASTRRELMN